MRVIFLVMERNYYNFQFESIPKFKTDKKQILLSLMVQSASFPLGRCKWKRIERNLLMKFKVSNKNACRRKIIDKNLVNPNIAHVRNRNLGTKCSQQSAWSWLCLERNAELAKLADGANYSSICNSVNHALFHRYRLNKRSQDCPSWWSKELPRRTASSTYENPPEFARHNEQQAPPLLALECRLLHWTNPMILNLGNGLNISWFWIKSKAT